MLTIVTAHTFNKARQTNCDPCMYLKMAKDREKRYYNIGTKILFDLIVLKKETRIC